MDIIMSLKEKLLKSIDNKNAALLQEQTIFDQDQVVTHVPIMNVALSGKLDGGFKPGVTILAGESRQFKTNITLILISAYLKKYPDGYAVFFDSEMGASLSYFKSAGIDLDRVIHIPVTDVEQLKFNAIKILDQIERGEHVIMALDSIGNLASKKEAEDALNEKSVADLSRPKAFKSFFRIITPHLSLKGIPFIGINHIMKTMDFIPKNVMTGGQGILLAANNVFFITRAQEKDGSDLIGYNFTINVEKSRFIREKQKLPLTVTFEGGINKYSGLFDLALELGFIHKNSAVSYSRMFLDKNTWELVPEDKKWRRKEADCKEFWEPMLNDEYFKETVEKHYLLDAPTFSTSEADELVSEDE